MNVHAAHVITALGGTAEVARLFGISMPSVTNWKEQGIPLARMMFLRLAKEEVLSGLDLDAATSAGHRPLLDFATSPTKEQQHA